MAEAALWASRRRVPGSPGRSVRPTASRGRPRGPARPGGRGPVPAYPPPQPRGGASPPRRRAAHPRAGRGARVGPSSPRPAPLPWVRGRFPGKGDVGAARRGLRPPGPAIPPGAGPERVPARVTGREREPGRPSPRSLVMPEADKERPPVSRRGDGYARGDGTARLAPPPRGSLRGRAPTVPGEEARRPRTAAGAGTIRLRPGAAPKGKPALRLPGYK